MDESKIKEMESIYSTYVTDAVSITGKRMTLNSLYVTINSGFIALIGTDKLVNQTVIFIGLIALILINIQWLFALLNFQKLSEAKFEIIEELESKLGINIYVREWEKLKEKKYEGLTSFDKGLPIIFIAAMIGILISAT